MAGFINNHVVWFTQQAQMLFYADKWLDYTKTLNIALKMLKNERWLFKDYKLSEIQTSSDFRHSM